MPRPKAYPPAVRGRVPPVRFGRSVEVKGAPPFLVIALLTVEVGREDRNGRVTLLDVGLDVRFRREVENHRFC